jgi:hypothetical protein
MQVREYGNFLRINLSEVLTGSTVTLELYRPNSSTPIVITTSNGLLIGSLDIEVKGKTYTAFEYIQYQIAEGVIDVEGIWSAVVTVADSGGTTFRITKKLKFTVTDC